MTELSLYKFISENNIEWKFAENDGKQDVFIFPSIFQLENFHQLLTPGIFDDGGVQCFMMNGYFAFWMQDICDYYGIEIKNVFKEE